MKSILKNSNGNAVSTGGKLLGITEGYVKPSGTLEITDTNLTDVTSYASAQVVDSNLIADNIKKDIAILGITGTYEGESGSAGTPIEVATAEEMDALLNDTSNIGKIYLYTGTTTENYTNGKLYIIEEV